MGAMEPASSGEGYETDSSSSNKVEGSLVNTMRRATSVDDLFAPLWSLNVHASPANSQHQSSSSAAEPSTNPSPTHVWNASSSTAQDSPSRRAAPMGQSSSAPSVNKPELNVVMDSATDVQRPSTREAKTGSERNLEIANGMRGSSSSRSSSQVSDGAGADVKPAFFPSDPEPCPAFTAGTRGTGKPGSGGGMTDGTLPPSQSTSDDDQLNGGLDERKQKRMLSNRESARRSRLRKQQHLDELRAQVAQLRAENNDMLAKFGLASQRYSQLTGENLVLRTHAVDLSRKLQQLHHTVATQHPNGLRALGNSTGHLDPLPLGTFPSGQHQLSPYSRPLVPDV